MICQECNQRPAALHFTKIVNGEKTEIHLCEKCAQEKGDMFMLHGTPGFSINNLLAGLLSAEPNLQQHNQNQNPFNVGETNQCSNCGMTFRQFVKVGRFGCASCYGSFKNQLKPILRRLHSGNWQHSGKIPARIGGEIHIRKELGEKKQQLANLVVQEEFEKAAELRDIIRQLEKQMEELQQGGE